MTLHGLNYMQAFIPSVSPVYRPGSDTLMHCGDRPQCLKIIPRPVGVMRTLTPTDPEGGV